MNALAASAEADVDVERRVVLELTKYRATLEHVLAHLENFKSVVGPEKMVSRRVATGAVEVMAGLIEEALGR